MALDGKVAIVTGGNSWIGRSVALGLAKAGASLVIDYVVHPEATKALEQEIIGLGDTVIGVNADVSKVSELQRLIDVVVAKFGRVDIMVNNAGVETRTSVLDTKEEQYTRVLDINLKSAFFGTQIAARQMMKQGGGGRRLGDGRQTAPRRVAVRTVRPIAVRDRPARSRASGPAYDELLGLDNSR